MTVAISDMTAVVYYLLGINMKIIFPLVMVCILLNGCVANYDERLIGTWKSDRERTVTEFNRRFPDRFKDHPEKQEKFGRIFGYLIHSYTPTEVTSELGGETSTIKYKVTKKTDNFVIIKIAGEEFQLMFEDNFQYYWSETWGIREYYKKTQ